MQPEVKKYAWIRMQNWIFYGIVAAICFGINTVIYKIASQKGNFSAANGSLIFGVGIMIAFLIYYLMKPGFIFEWKSSSLLIIAGIIWAIGFLSIAIAISQKGNVSQLAPIYNTNTIVAVFLGIILLKEVPDMSQMIRIIIGALMIVGGAILVSI